MNMKTTAILASASLLLAGCGGKTSGSIHILTREDGSGTQGAFCELFDLKDSIATDAEVTNSTSVMIATVAGDAGAIGYISLGSLSEDVKAVNIDGIAPSIASVSDGSYAIKRPFIALTNPDTLTPAAEDFLSYILSDQGQQVIQEAGYVAAETTKTYTVSASGLEGSVTVGGSSSVAPLMEVLAESYMALNPNVTILVQQSDSSTGISSTLQGTYEIGLSSRELKDSEKDGSLEEAVIAWDGIAVIVNNENAVSSLTSEQVHAIYTGALTSWNEIQ